ncbi:MAG: UV DNA damage repair endonuclease UvsE [Armatimonadota bacterium]|nr:UV DNA damage repair endonuclease UvsE [bacterium]
MRFGFAVKVLGDGGLPSHDTRRWQSGPHLSVSIGILRDVLAYLERMNIMMYRMSSDFVPYGTHPEMPQFHGQIDECRSELEDVGKEACRLGIRLSLHPSQFVVLNAIDEEVARKAAADLLLQSELLDSMELGDEAVVVTHVGGLYGDRESSIQRFTDRWQRLPEPAKRRVVVENDERMFNVADTLRIHEITGCRLIFDYQHHMLNPGRLSLNNALRKCLATWPTDQTPKIHFSSPRTEIRMLERKDPVTRKKVQVPQPPLISQHADYINPLEYMMFMEHAEGLAFDVMLEAKAKDLALLALRKFLNESMPST